MLLIVIYNDTATTENYPLSQHDALPISSNAARPFGGHGRPCFVSPDEELNQKRPDSAGFTWHMHCSLRYRQPSGHETMRRCLDRKSTRLNSSHLVISYAVFCLIKNISQH